MSIIAKPTKRIYGIKYLQQHDHDRAAQTPYGPFSGYRGYLLPGKDEAGSDLPGRWSKPFNPHLCHSGWHFYHKTPSLRLRKKWAAYIPRRWFLVEGEGPFKMDSEKCAARRIRFIRDITPPEGERIKPISHYVTAARKDGLL